VRIAYTSDLHTDFGPWNAALLEHLVARAAALHPDVLVVAGDVAETLAAVRDSLQAFATVPCRRLYVPGNHDLYAERTPRGTWITSRKKYEHDLPAAARGAGFEPLGKAPVRLDAWTFVGVPGWYDFTLRDPALDVSVALQQYRNGMWRDQRAFDRGHVLWDAWPDTGASRAPATAPSAWLGDEAIAAILQADLEAQLAAAPSDVPIVAVVHVRPDAALVQRHAFAPSAFHDAYLGSGRLGACLVADRRVRAVITGHLHRPADVMLGTVHAVARPVGNLRQAAADWSACAAERMGCLDLD
jgi:hypothetical protein